MASISQSNAQARCPCNKTIPPVCNEQKSNLCYCSTSDIPLNRLPMIGGGKKPIILENDQEESVCTCPKVPLALVNAGGKYFACNCADLLKRSPPSRLPSPPFTLPPQIPDPPLKKKVQSPFMTASKDRASPKFLDCDCGELLKATPPVPFVCFKGKNDYIVAGSSKPLQEEQAEQKCPKGCKCKGDGDKTNIFLECKDRVLKFKDRSVKNEYDSKAADCTSFLESKKKKLTIVDGVIESDEEDIELFKPARNLLLDEPFNKVSTSKDGNGIVMNIYLSCDESKKDSMKKICRTIPLNILKIDDKTNEQFSSIKPVYDVTITLKESGQDDKILEEEYEEMASDRIEEEKDIAQKEVEKVRTKDEGEKASRNEPTIRTQRDERSERPESILKERLDIQRRTTIISSDDKTERIKSKMKSDSEKKSDKPLQEMVVERVDKMGDEQSEGGIEGIGKKLKVKGKKSRKRKKKVGSIRVEAQAPEISEGSKSSMSQGSVKSDRVKGEFCSTNVPQEYIQGMYPGIHVGHATCCLPQMYVPPDMGWLWNLCEGAGIIKPALNWKPGAIMADVAKVMAQMGDKSYKPKKVKGERPKKVQESKVIQPSSPLTPALQLLKKKGQYVVAMNPATEDDEKMKGVKKSGKANNENSVIVTFQPKSSGTTSSSSDEPHTTTTTDDSLQLDYITAHQINKRKSGLKDTMRMPTPPAYN